MQGNLRKCYMRPGRCDGEVLPTEPDTKSYKSNGVGRNSNIVLKNKVMDQTTTCKNTINEMKNENFIKENKIIIINHLNETKNNFRTTVTTNGPSTSYSSKGFYNGSPEMKKSLIGFCKKKFPDGKYFFLYFLFYFIFSD